MNEISGNYLNSNVDTQAYVAKLDKLLAIQVEQLRLQNKNENKKSESFTKEGIEVINLSAVNSNLEIHNLVYQMTNLLNGHFYIGKHSTRYPLDSYYGSGIILKEAFLKYGLSSFQKKILYDFETSEEALQKEEELMPVLSCHDNNPCCYNMKPGGVGHLLSSSAKKGARSRKRHGYVMPIKTRLKVSRSNKDKPKSDLHKLHLSDNHRENRDYMYKIQSTGEIIVETTTIPRIAKKFNITNAQLLKRKSKRCEFYKGILIVSLIDYESAYYRQLSKDQKIYIDPITKQQVSYYQLRFLKTKREYQVVGNIFSCLSPQYQYTINESQFRINLLRTLEIKEIDYATSSDHH